MKTALQKAREAPESTKARILNAAEDVFATRGFDGASTREIASKAGVNISSLHYHWESKETLYQAVFHEIYAKIFELARAAIESVKGGDARASVENAMGQLVDFFMDHTTIPRLLLRRVLESAGGSPKVEHEMLTPAWDAFVGFMRDVGLPIRRKLDGQLFMLSAHSIVLLFTLDSQAYRSLLGGRLDDPALRRAIRRHVIEVTMRLLDWETS